MFNKEKLTFLQKKDKSKKGVIDEGIKRLVDLINSLPDYYTTSSCAGRILIFCPGDKKRLTKWLFVSHKKVFFAQIKKCLSLMPNLMPKQDVWFRQESFILHVCCSNVEAAQRLLDVCSKLGLKRAGITTTKRKTLVELLGTEHFDTIIAKDGQLLVNDAFLKVLIEAANKRLNKNIAKLNKLYEIIKKKLKN